MEPSESPSKADRELWIRISSSWICNVCGAKGELWQLDIDGIMGNQHCPKSSCAGRLMKRPKGICVECGHAGGLHYGPEGVCVADCRSLDPLIQCGCKEFVMPHAATEVAREIQMAQIPMRDLAMLLHLADAARAGNFDQACISKAKDISGRYGFDLTAFKAPSIVGVTGVATTETARETALQLAIRCISEAIRQHIITNGPSTARQLSNNLEWGRIRTRTGNRQSLVTSTLASMHDSGAIHRVGPGLWDVERNSPTRPEQKV